MWGDSESASKNTSTHVIMKFSEPLNKKFLKIRASDLVEAKNNELSFAIKIKLNDEITLSIITTCKAHSFYF